MQERLSGSGLFSAIVEYSRDMIFVFRLEDASIVYVNPAVQEMLGYSLEELRELGIDGIRRPLRADETFMIHLEALRTETGVTDYAMVRLKGGGEIPVEVRPRIIEIEGIAYNLAMVRDIGERYDNDLLFRDFVEGSKELLIRIDAEGNLLYLNPTAEKMFGMASAEALGRSAFEFVHPEEQAATKTAYASWLQQRLRYVEHETRQLGADGRVHHILWHVHIHYDAGGQLLYANVTGSDISARVRAERQLFELNAALEEKVALRTRALQQKSAFLEGYKLALDANNIVSKSDRSGIITYVNDNFVRVTGFSREEAVGRPHNIVRDPETPKEIFEQMWRTIGDKRAWKGILRNRRKDGGYYWVDIVILPILDENGEIFEFIAVRHEITELVEKREKLEKIAYTDALTGLPNRQRLLEAVAGISDATVGLLNIDGFSQVNDFFGHGVGDGLITALAGNIRGQMKGTGYRAYRLHGDEFAVLCTDGDASRFETWMRLLVDTLNGTTVVVEENAIIFDLSAGIASASGSDLLSFADIALKNAKRSQNNVVVYDDTLAIAEQYEHNQLWSKKLRSAIRDDRIAVYYQPLVDNRTGVWEKYEALVRMIDEEGAVVSPFYFLGIAKKSRQYYRLTQIVVEKAFEAFRERDARVSVNLTIDDILDPELQRYLFDMIERHGMGPKLIFELVESEGIENFDAVSAFVTRAKAMGCRLAIDDFGTGYSNFEYLMRLQADFIKIDGSLIRNIDTDMQARAIVATIVEFAKKVGLQTVAEFVRDAAVQRAVEELGIDYSQGFYFSEPLPEPPERP